MTAYVIFTRERLRDPAEMEAYRKANATLDEFGGRPLAVYGKQEMLEGSAHEGAVVLEFPDFESAKAWYDSPTYTRARAHRHAGADYRAFIVEGL